jgi:hypothetical protein
MLHYPENCGQNKSIKGFWPQRSSNHSKEHTLSYDVQVHSGFLRHPSGQNKKEAIHVLCHSTPETSSSLEPYRHRSGKHLEGEYI